MELSFAYFISFLCLPRVCRLALICLPFAFSLFAVSSPTRISFSSITWNLQWNGSFLSGFFTALCRSATRNPSVFMPLLMFLWVNWCIDAKHLEISICVLRRVCQIQNALRYAHTRYSNPPFYCDFLQCGTYAKCFVLLTMDLCRPNIWHDSANAKLRDGKIINDIWPLYRDCSEAYDL